MTLALRQQVAALKKERPRPVLDDLDRAFWVALRASWSGRGVAFHWAVIEQLREAFPYDTAPKYLTFNRDAIFSPAVATVVIWDWPPVFDTQASQ